MAEFESIDPQALPRRYDAAETEGRWERAWREAKLHHYDETRPREETFVVDTPPPTVSGALHIGHVFSYTQTDVIVRYQRMRGRNIFYPMGWDDNGVPTERRVQNLFHVRCDPSLPPEPGRALEPATAKLRKKPPRAIARRDFLDLCGRVTSEDERAFCELFRRIGLSVDWRSEYSTINPRCRQLAQHSFLDLFEKGHAYTLEAPFMWDVDFQMALSQADVEDRLQPGAWHDIEFGVVGEDTGFVISTTRPELLPACVGVTAHPEDSRFRHLFGKRARTPLFHAPVPIFASERADPEKGTGILMICTFGDQSDVEWWREEKLPLRQVLGRDGRLRAEPHFGEGVFESLEPDAANRCYAKLKGKRVGQARRRVVELLSDAANAASGRPAPLRTAPRPMEHALRFYEKGEQPLEILPSRQWFIRLLDKKDALLQKGAEVRWRPPHMEQRFRDWTQNLALDWCVSRQRYFGVPIPVWYPLDQSGRPSYDEAIVADAAALPVDPMTDTPPGYSEAQRGSAGGFIGEADIFDTWFTSSLSPQIGSGWPLDPARHQRLFPADLRPQAHEIIRTWAFYTIAKALLHEDKAPWRNIAISGWVLDPERRKMSKSIGNALTPLPLIEQFSADPVRYWAASARLGVDTALDEAVFRVGKRLVTKLWNASKFVLSQQAQQGPVCAELDRAFVAELRALVARATRDFENFESARALQETEHFFWTRFTDNYLELVKPRAKSEHDMAGRSSAVHTLRLALTVLLRLFAPVLPHISEEIWSWVFAGERGERFIHGATWPETGEFEHCPAPAEPGCFEAATKSFAAINRAKAEAQVSQGRALERLELAAHPASLAQLEPALPDLLQTARCRSHKTSADATLDEGVIKVREAVFAARPDEGEGNGEK